MCRDKSIRDGHVEFTGKLKSDDDLEHGKAARLCVINMLAALKDYLKDLDRVKNIVKL